MRLEGMVSFKCRQKQKENSHEGITWSEMGKLKRSVKRKLQEYLKHV